MYCYINFSGVSGTKRSDVNLLRCTKVTSRILHLREGVSGVYNNWRLFTFVNLLNIIPTEGVSTVVWKVFTFSFQFVHYGYKRLWWEVRTCTEKSFESSFSFSVSCNSFLLFHSKTNSYSVCKRTGWPLVPGGPVAPLTPWGPCKKPLHYFSVSF